VKPPGAQPGSQVLPEASGCAQDSSSPDLLLAVKKPSSPSQKGKAFKNKKRKIQKKKKKIKLEKKIS